ncbi:hypothetical protein ES705_03547 [subsurface metagenome]
MFISAFLYALRRSSASNFFNPNSLANLLNASAISVIFLSKSNWKLISFILIPLLVDSIFTLNPSSSVNLLIPDFSNASKYFVIFLPSSFTIIEPNLFTSLTLISLNSTVNTPVFLSSVALTKLSSKASSISVNFPSYPNISKALVNFSTLPILLISTFSCLASNISLKIVAIFSCPPRSNNSANFVKFSSVKRNFLPELPVINL